MKRPRPRSGNRASRLLKPFASPSCHDGACAVLEPLPEPESDPGQERVLSEPTRVHGARCGFAQDPHVSEPAVGEVGDHETRHVRAGGGEHRGRHRPCEILRDAPEARASEPVADGPIRFRACVREAASSHAERPEDVLDDEGLERQSRGLLDQVSGERHAVVRIADELSGRHHPWRHAPGEIRAQ